jgi:hypothetical protein
MLDRRAVMVDAWRRYRDGQRLGLGWSFGRCLSTAWAAAKIRRDAMRQNHRPGPERAVKKPGYGQAYFYRCEGMDDFRVHSF